MVAKPSKLHKLHALVTLCSFVQFLVFLASCTAWRVCAVLCSSAQLHKQDALMTSACKSAVFVHEVAIQNSSCFSAAGSAAVRRSRRDYALPSARESLFQLGYGGRAGAQNEALPASPPQLLQPRRSEQASDTTKSSSAGHEKASAILLKVCKNFAQ